MYFLQNWNLALLFIKTRDFWNLISYHWCQCLCILNLPPGKYDVVYLLSKSVQVLVLFDKPFLEYIVHTFAALSWSHPCTENLLEVSRYPFLAVCPHVQNHVIIMKLVFINELVPSRLKFSWHQGPIYDCLKLSLETIVQLVQVWNVWGVLVCYMPSAKLV